MKLYKLSTRIFLQCATTKQVKTGESEKTRGSKEKTDGRFSVADEPYSESEVTTVLFVYLRI